MYKLNIYIFHFQNGIKLNFAPCIVSYPDVDWEKKEVENALDF